MISRLGIPSGVASRWGASCRYYLLVVGPDVCTTSGRQVHVPDSLAGGYEDSTQLPNVLQRDLQRRALGILSFSAPVQPVVEVRLPWQLLRLPEAADDSLLQGPELLLDSHQADAPPQRKAHTSPHIWETCWQCQGWPASCHKHIGD